ncbi:ATP-dependent DNA helicase [Mycoplasma struthionis]|nr:AAA family ATPase [Mycoplasma struthionis]
MAKEKEALKPSIIKGTVQRILWSSDDTSVVICVFKVTVNDPINTINLNRDNTISLVFKDDLYRYSDVQMDGREYGFSVILNQRTRYANSYIAKSKIDVNDRKEFEVAYIVKILKSSNFPGIGEEKAKWIVKDLGTNALKRMVEENIDYTKYKLSEENWNEAINFLKNNPQLIKDQMTFLKLNLSTSLYELIKKKIRKKHFDSFDEFIEKYKDNFYLFYLEDEDVRLEDMDKLSLNYSEYKNEHPFKPATHIYKALYDYFYNTGHTRIRSDKVYEELLINANKDLEWPREIKQFNQAIKLLLESEYLQAFNYEDGIYYSTKKILDMEEYIVKRLQEISTYKVPKQTVSFSHHIHFDKKQKEAIEAAINENLVLITGYPGTGKTLITNKIIEDLKNQYGVENLAIVTPTGRATINLNNYEDKIIASTIHSFLEFDPDNQSFNVNERNKKSIDCLIIDEFSMVSLDLFYSLLIGLKSPNLKKIILVGDKDQLPAIGPGYLIRDFIEGNLLKIIKLEHVYRQAENYDIIADSLMVNEGKMPLFKGKQSRFIQSHGNDLKDQVLKQLKLLLDEGYSKHDIAILSPVYKYDAGIDNINQELLNFYREKENAVIEKINTRTLALDDKVINTVNDSRGRVFNGEIGYISHITFDSKKDPKHISHVAIDFENDKKTVTFNRSDFVNAIEPAYCTSVHKYQGSEAKIVLVILFTEAQKLLTKKLIYTAITRAKKLCIVIGEKEALEMGLASDVDSNRLTNIQWIKNKLNN